jgi:hypothetical protein
MNVSDTESTKAWMTLLGGALGFSAVALSIINGYLQKSKTEKARIKVIMTMLNISGMILAVTGAIVMMVSGFVLAPLLLFAVSCILHTTVYIISPDIPSKAYKAYTIVIIIMICNVFFYINTYMIGRILGLVERNTSLIGKLIEILNKH